MTNIKMYDKSLCSGCSSCEQVCPTSCIKMELDREGFWYPYIDESLCTHCSLCINHCPILYETRNETVIASYGLIHKEKSVTFHSASGGAFTAIAEYVLSKNGIVFGCIFNEEIEAITISIEALKDLHLLCGSKYVQCDTRKQYSKMKEMLQKGRYVLYCATPCQIAGLKAYLNVEYENLILVDLFCHGTPSPGLFKRYITWLSKKHKGKIMEYSFRDKKYGWGTKGHFIVDKEYELYATDPYYDSFLKGKTYRPICYNCKYADIKRTGDISIGDFWGVEQYHPEVSVQNGVSAVLINTKKGSHVFESIKENIYTFETTIYNISSNNKQLIYPTEKHYMRDKIYADIDKLSFDKLAKKYLYSESILLVQIKRSIPEPIKNIIRKLRRSI